MSNRLDVALTERGLAESRTRAVELIKCGLVSVSGTVVTKPSYAVETDTVITVSADRVCPYVSRGGLKLAAALDRFHLKVEGCVCADIGASSGGFTDCLLKNGAARVYAVDSGAGQLHFSLRNDPRVISREGCNARYLDETVLPEPVSLMVMDVSFISQTKLYAAVLPHLAVGGTLVTLIKPQFEVGRSGVGKGGLVRDEKKRREAVAFVCEAARIQGMVLRGVIPSPIRGGDGNAEFLACFVKPKTETEGEIPL